MIKTNNMQLDHLEFNHSPFLTQPRFSNCTPANIHSKKQQAAPKVGLALTNICFDHNQQKVSSAEIGKRIHGKQTIKKLGQAKLLLAKSLKRQKVQNVSKQGVYKMVKQQIQMSSKNLQKSKFSSPRASMGEASTSVLDSAFESVGPGKVKKKISKAHFERMSMELSSSVVNEDRTQVICSVLQLQVKPFENVKRKIQNDENGEEQKGFYKKLKNKIQRAMNKLQEKQSANKENLAIQGCKLHKSSQGPLSQRKSLTDRLSARTSLSRAGLEFKDRIHPQKGRRPRTARISTSERKEILYQSARSNKLFHQDKKNIRSTISYNQKVSQFSIPKNHKTLKHVSPISRKDNYIFSGGQIKRQRIKQKMLSILVDCDIQNQQSHRLQSGLAVFEEFTGKMTKGLSKMSQKLQRHTQGYQDKYQ